MDIHRRFEDEETLTDLPTSATVKWRRRRRFRPFTAILRWIRHPTCPRLRPLTIIIILLFCSVIAFYHKQLLKLVGIKPPKPPRPWRMYCSVPSMVYPFNMHYAFPAFSPKVPDGQLIPSFPPNNLDDLPPAGIFLAVFTFDKAFERRMLIRSSWPGHPRSRNGAGKGDGGVGTSRTIVRFVLGQPRNKEWERKLQLEQEAYNDLIILPIQENMNDGKTHAYYTWAAANAWVPPVYETNMSTAIVSPPKFSYSSETSPAPTKLAQHDPALAWVDLASSSPKPWVRPDYVAKMDDDAFVMLAELETRLRVELHQPLLQPWMSKPNNDPLIYWGYLLETFMAGELYALSWSLVDYIAKDEWVKTTVVGGEDTVTAKWMWRHPRAAQVKWVYERCWIYDHPRSITPYSRGFTYPSEITRVRKQMSEMLESKTGNPFVSPGHEWPDQWSHSSVARWQTKYSPPAPDLELPHSVEALVEGSEMSLLTPGSAIRPADAWKHREDRTTRYEGKRVGGTILIHYIKKDEWYMETSIAMLEGEDHHAD